MLHVALVSGLGEPCLELRGVGDAVVLDEEHLESGERAHIEGCQLVALQEQIVQLRASYEVRRRDLIESGIDAEELVASRAVERRHLGIHHMDAVQHREARCGEARHLGGEHPDVLQTGCRASVNRGHALVGCGQGQRDDGKAVEGGRYGEGPLLARVHDVDARATVGDGFAVIVGPDLIAPGKDRIRFHLVIREPVAGDLLRSAVGVLLRRDGPAVAGLREPGFKERRVRYPVILAI